MNRQRVLEAVEKVRDAARGLTVSNRLKMQDTNERGFNPVDLASHIYRNVMQANTPTQLEAISYDLGYLFGMSQSVSARARSLKELQAACEEAHKLNLEWKCRLTERPNGGRVDTIRRNRMVAS